MSARPLALLLALAACAPDAPPDAIAPAPDALPDTAMVRAVAPESTAALLGGDLAFVSPSVAIQTVDLWVARLDTVSAEGASEVSADLTQLRNLLQSSPLDGAAIGRTLRDLGDGTAALAPAGTPLAALADALTVQGRRLAPDSTDADASGAPASPLAH